MAQTPSILLDKLGNGEYLFFHRESKMGERIWCFFFLQFLNMFDLFNYI